MAVVELVMHVRCFLVDGEGYIIAHDDFVIPPQRKNIIPAIADIHITKKVLGLTV